ncbi:phosphoribosylformylglycinamidine cyclo-ligase [Dissulfurirhabdus thermomarina]|uniref:Phosphoribosylformylglycinamidine cyclo-ligase n=1 Tax=Dissulfurirhabdus thermomarina TaxID=1765737 RepID=A0A6N9TLH0_DISTH|nr:phosphoribosylformylglycinamidine cyclo-ligase [Dissulfurirhabdus thermomarina]NDY41969.1 phosphoribosylformylglycinamidine cyclo-ligase [Dissulfurirhabdus thermomarina]NMX22808.1 phosphoribosylformylglycinamidine cyclo-ligase [Dissulfurirhabdus thermomarina]
MTRTSRYAQAGVDIDKANRLVDRIRPLVAATRTPGVITELGGFAGLFALDTSGLSDPVLVASTDGVGTKLKVAVEAGIHGTVGIDLVAMSVNDILVCGARPLFFLDYFATGRLDPDVAAEVIGGIAEGCRQAGCALIGGETAEMPGMYAAGDYDLAGFVVGVADRSRLIDGSRVREGDALVGLASSGLHSNGFSLVRKICFEERGLDVRAPVPALGNRPLGEVLLTPTRIYARAVARILEAHPVSGMVHVTGGGFVDNIPRVLPGHLQAVIRRESWPVPAVFTFLREAGDIPDEEMFRTFNCGIGMVLVVPGETADAVLETAAAAGEPAYRIGEVRPRPEGAPAVAFAG